MKLLGTAFKVVFVAGVGYLIIRSSAKAVDDKKTNKAFDAVRYEKPEWYAQELALAFEYDTDTGGTDEESIMDILSQVPHEGIWLEILNAYPQIGDFGWSLNRRLSHELDNDELKIANGIIAGYPPDKASRENLWKQPFDTTHIGKALFAAAHKLYFWLNRGGGFWGTAFMDEHWQRVAGTAKAIPFAGFFPAVARGYQSIFKESLLGTMLDKLDDDQWIELHSIITNKPDAKGKTLHEIFRPN